MHKLRLVPLILPEGPSCSRRNLAAKFYKSPGVAPPQVARPLTFRIQHFGNVQVLLCNLHGQVDISHGVVLQETRHVQMFKGVFLDI